MEIDLEQIGERIKQCRVKAGLSQRALGALMDAASSYISQIEQGKANFTISMLARFATEFNVSADWLLGADTAEAAQTRNKEADRILSDCTPDEAQCIITVMQDVKTGLKKNTK